MTDLDTSTVGETHAMNESDAANRRIMPRRYSKPMSILTKVAMIEDAVKIGESEFADLLISQYFGGREPSENNEAYERLNAAKEQLAALHAYEAEHGLYSKLDRQAPLIRELERAFRFMGLPPAYPPKTPTS